MLKQLGALPESRAANRMPAMHLLLNTTSPYARIARIALAEKGHADIATEVVDPWGDTPRLLEFNSAARVPALVTDEGRPLTESLLIVLWLENRWPTPSLLGSDPTAAVSRAGIAMGVIDAAVHTLIGRKITDASFDTSSVGLRRRRSMIQGLSRLQADPPADATGIPTIDTIAAVVALDYVNFRFPLATWLPALPRLDALAGRAHQRSSFATSMPRELPKA
jgi:glutathione S-transferase